LWQSSRQLAGILPASRPRRRLKSMAWEKPRRGKTEAAAEFLSRRTRRKPAGASQVPARRQFTFPVKSDAPRAKPARMRVQQTGVALIRCTPEADQIQPEADFKSQRLSVQQIATPEVRNCAFLGRFVCFLRSATIALIHAG
jgi:hypothetical protein